MNSFFKAGQKVRCNDSHGYPQLTEGRIYTTARDSEPGIFQTEYVTVLDDFGEKTVAHATRFNLTVARYAYKNTHSSMGKGVECVIDVDDIIKINCWHCINGNPSYVYHMKNGDSYYLVDDFGAMNDIRHLSRVEVKRKKDLFIF